MAWHVIFSGVGGGANQVRSWQTLLCYFLFVFFSVSFNHPDHRMLGVLSLVWPFFSPLCIFCLDVTLSYGFNVILCWHCCTRSSLLPTGFLCGEQGQLLVVVYGLLIAVASLTVEHGLQACGLQ